MRKRSLKRFITRVNMVILRNPILIEGLAIATAVMTTTRVLDTLCMVLALIIMALPTALVVYPLSPKLPTYARAILYAVIACIMYIPAYFIIRTISQQAVANLTIYLPLLVLNELVITRSEKALKQRRFGSYMLSAFTDLFGFSLVMFAVASLREILAFGTFFGIALDTKIKIPMVALPFMGFIIVGYLSAMIRWTYAKIMQKVSRKRLKRPKTLILSDGEVNV